MSASKVITQDRMLPSLVEVDPAFEPIWLQLKAYCADEPGLPLYLVLADLARHLVAQLERGHTAGFDAVFDLVERWNVDGDSDVQEAATIGLPEDLWNGNLHERTRPRDVEPWLGRESRLLWNELNLFWSRVAGVTLP